MDTCLAISQKHVPERKAKHEKKSHIPPHRKRLMRNRARILRSIDTCTRPSQKRKMEQRLIEIEASLRISREQQSKSDEDKAVDSIRQNPKYFFSYANKHSKVIPIFRRACQDSAFRNGSFQVAITITITRTFVALITM